MDEGRLYSDVINKFSRLERLPIFLTNGASRAEAPLLRLESQITDHTMHFKHSMEISSRVKKQTTS